MSGVIVVGDGGIMMALRSRLAPLIFLMRPSSLRSMGPNGKVHLGPGQQSRPTPGHHRPGDLGWAFGLAIIGGLNAPAITALGEGLQRARPRAKCGPWARALDFGQRHAELARKLAHRGNWRAAVPPVAYAGLVRRAEMASRCSRPHRTRRADARRRFPSRVRSTVAPAPGDLCRRA